MSPFSSLRFSWDPAKSAINQGKHGLSLAAAPALWLGPVVIRPSKYPGESRHLAIGLIEGRCWTVVYTPRNNTLRLISARRARENEKALFQEFYPPERYHRREP